MKKKAIMALGLLFLLSMNVMGTSASPYLVQAQDKICSVLQTIYELLIYIAGGVGALVITMQGLTWIASADDPATRKTAKTAIIHVLIGLVIISLALVLVAMVLPDSAGCVEDWPGWPGTI